ncbi:MAG: NERD domain-containing protein [Chloroflexota bacterium]
MRLIDHTPYLSESGEISLGNQILAALKYGTEWYPAIKAQQFVVDNLNRNLAKGYTLLRNIVLPGSRATIPLILVGPAGISVIVVTNLKGTYRANNDNWEVIEGDKSRSAKSNLLVLTSKMTRAVQLFLRKRGIEAVEVDGVLICVEAGMHVESSRPIVRVVMRDAIEHFVISLNQANLTLTDNLVQTTISMLTEQGSNQQPAPAVEGSVSQPVDGSVVNPVIEDVFPWSDNFLDFEFKDDPSQDLEKPFRFSSEPTMESSPIQKERQSVPLQLKFDKKQWIVLICFALVEITILLVFFWLVYSNS